jgi:hypothetical protein
MKALTILSKLEELINSFGPQWNLFGVLDDIKALLCELRQEIESTGIY